MTWDLDVVCERALRIQRVAAPTGQEHARAELLQAMFASAGLQDITRDATPNVYGRLGRPADGPGVLVSAHLDTVFPADMDLTSRREGSRLYGPGIGDNSMGLAALVTLGERLRSVPISELRRPVWFVANAGEEGMGNLVGMHAAVDRLADRIDTCIVLEGGGYRTWRITHEALGVRRYRIYADAEGGHSWADFGAPNAIHALATVAAAIAAWDVPDAPRSSYNIGTIQGGTSVNTIAAHAEMLLDLRSVDGGTLVDLARRVQEVVEQADKASAAHIGLDVVGDRPTGSISEDHPLVAWARELIAVHDPDPDVTPDSVEAVVSSTDANVPLSRGIPAVTLFLGVSEGTHTEDEWLDVTRLPISLEVAYQLILRAANRGRTDTLPG